MAIYVAQRFVHRYIPPGKKDKDGRAIKFKSGDSDYRVYLPVRSDVSPLRGGGRQISYAMDHIKGFGTGPALLGGDKHASIMVQFNRKGHIIGVDIDLPGSPRVKIPLKIEKGKVTVETEIPLTDIANAIFQSAGDNHFKHVILTSIRHLDYAVIKRRKR